jgi:hypothetical protein
MRYNRAATLDHGPLITTAPVRSAAVPPDSGEPRSQDDPREAQEARAYFSEGRERSIDLLQKAICTLEDEIEELNPVVDPTRDWAVGGDGTILATTDGGATWQKRDSGVRTIFGGVLLRARAVTCSITPCFCRISIDLASLSTCSSA